jgi:hypothetical protein
MATSLTLPASGTVAAATARAGARAARLPLRIYAVVLSSLSIVVGLIWDISWHLSIGRDGLFSPPHLMIYLGAVVAGTFAGYDVLKNSFWGTPAAQGRRVRFWGVFHGTLGSLFCIWGALAMLTSAPFDDWWHNTYGLDVTILSPPHTVLVLGMMMVQFGAIVDVLALQNRPADPVLTAEQAARRQRRLQLLFVASAGFSLTILYLLASEYLDRFAMHASLFYQVSAALFPLLLLAVARASGLRWAMTYTALTYFVVLAGVNWTVQLFPATPKLGPILYHITHFQPYQFPLLLILPTLAMDALRPRLAGRNDWVQAAALAGVFMAVLVPVQWLMGDWLMSPGARNWFFGSNMWYFSNSPDWEYRFQYAPWMVETGAVLARGLGIALGIAVLSARLGLAWGNWMRSVRR